VGRAFVHLIVIYCIEGLLQMGERGGATAKRYRAKVSSSDSRKNQWRRTDDNYARHGYPHFHFWTFTVATPII